MKILILNWRDIENPSAGGAEILTHEMAKRWVRWGHDVVQFSSVFPLCKEEELLDGVQIVRKGHPDVRSLFSSVHFQAFWYYQTHRKAFGLVIDEIHGIPFFTPWYIKEKKVVLICELADRLWQEMFGQFFGTLGFLTEKFYLRFVYKNLPYITISQSTKNDLVQNGIPEKNITVIPVGINTPQTQKTFRKEKDPTLVFVGRFVKSKGIEDTLMALKELTLKIRTVKLWIIGRGDEEHMKYIRKQASKNNLLDRIIFFGFVSQQKKFELLSRAWILVHPSLAEGWGINVIEAAWVGTPSVGYNVGGLRDSIRHGKTGFLTKENNAKSLTESLEKLIENRGLYSIFSKNAQIWAKDFTWERAGKKSLELLENVYGKS